MVVAVVVMESVRILLQWPIRMVFTMHTSHRFFPSIMAICAEWMCECGYNHIDSSVFVCVCECVCMLCEREIMWNICENRPLSKWMVAVARMRTIFQPKKKRRENIYIQYSMIITLHYKTSLQTDWNPNVLYYSSSSMLCDWDCDCKGHVNESLSL